MSDDSPDDKPDDGVDRPPWQPGDGPPWGRGAWRGRRWRDPRGRHPGVLFARFAAVFGLLVLLVLGLMHFFNLLVFTRMRRRALSHRPPALPHVVGMTPAR